MSSRRLSKAERDADAVIRKAIRERIRGIMQARGMTLDDLRNAMRTHGMRIGRQSLWGWMYQLSPPYYALPVIAKCFRMKDYRKLLPDLCQITVDKQTNCL